MRFCLFLLAASFTATLAKRGCEEKVAACEAGRGEGREEPVCGSDEITYPSRCHLIRAKCSGSPSLSVLRRGPCSESGPCWEEKRKEDGEFGAKCLPDGSYAPVQCHQETGYCWCVTSTGLHIPNTSVRHGKPNCPHRSSKQSKNVREEKRRKGKACGKVERVKFVNRLVKIFIVELRRHEETANQPRSKEEEYPKKSVEWKFSDLDANKDKNLTSNEYKEFKELVKKAVPPLRCSRALISLCDTNNDSVLGYEEWTECLVKKPVAKKNKKKKKPQPIDDGFSDDEFDDGPIFGGDLTGPSGLQGDKFILNGQISPTDESDLTLIRKEEEPQGVDCLADRKSVVNEQSTSNMELFLPECTPDGRYQKVQCYKSTGYCWCVNEDTGKPIPGTSRKDHHPNCDALQLPLRPIKGCPEEKKKLFLKELKDFFKKQITGGPEIVAENNNEEFALRTFQIIDKNKNKVLEKKEMKPFRTQMATFSQPIRRCGKKFAKYCDVNHDRKISTTEWINCLDSERSGEGMTVSPGPRKGPNPLETILKPDDD